MEYILISILTLTLFYVRNNYFKHAQIRECDDFHYGRVNKISYVAIILLILFAGLRAYTIGYDVPNYYKNFQLILENKDLADGHSFELLYNLINLMCAYIFGESGFTFVLIICSAIIVFSVAYTAKQLSPDIALSMFLFVAVDVYLRGFGQIRQCVAIAILMLSVVCIAKKKPVLFVLCNVLAMLFHETSIIFLPTYLFVYINKKSKWQYISYGVMLGAAGIFCIFEELIIKIVCDIFSLKYYDLYVVQGLGIEKLTTFGCFEIIFNVLIFMFFLVYKIWYEKKNKQNIGKGYNLFLSLYLCAVLFYLVSAICGRPTLYGRLVYYFFWALIMLVPYFLKTIENKKVYYLFYVLMLFAGLIYLICSIYAIDAYGIMPYQCVI